ncbi:MAG: phosphatase PAP2 family protein [Prolixibacteraceae bacterium]|jgi:membrane-associated phospholipid phosphatase|nr:phosphatase PAP2 family protein [Prolixibacteraceae bacterium]MBT6006573.1 phosphatase PAP2 family protein [Prolixibacteraceae bacterium]MBT6763401.1 phosphatase PAP2 family protein [Prolixibacteraceae bacterium]MBT6997691.1 phosphatase PAP2 family protein [Prolixibacteraceae bacterium]MBT7393425.1 phosphatase PAP2 family protein [Prolixibacteraceae bacterium]
MKQLLKKNRFFFIPHLFFLLVFTVLLVSIPKAELHIISNRANNIFFDYFFKYATYLGDGTMIAILFIALLFIKYRYAFVFLTGSLFTGIVVQLFKQVLFEDMFRPSKYFELFETYQLHFVEGVNLHSHNSFPSGHTATAFNLFFMLALTVKNNTLKFLLFILAALVGYSRVYLSQHFLIDITIGSIIGVLLMLLPFLWFEKSGKRWLNKSLFSNR